MNELSHNHNPHPSPSTTEAAWLTALRRQRAIAAQRSSQGELLAPGEWLRRIGELQAPFGFDGMPTVLG